MTTRVGINGLGRIGRCALRRLTDDNDVELVGLNDLVPLDQLAYLVEHDSVHGGYPDPVRIYDSKIGLGNAEYPVFHESDPADLPWEGVGADVVIESTGAFRRREEAAGHLEAGAGRVIISAPSDDADVTVVPGVNDLDYDPSKHQVLSMASCTTNCVAPVLKVLQENFEVDEAMFTTVHAYTSSQSIVDGPSRKLRRGRAAAVSLVPTTTGAAGATSLVLPELEGRLDGMAIRAPVPDGSLIDLGAVVNTSLNRDAVLEAFGDAADNGLRGILDVRSDEPVSSDIVGSRLSAIVDAPLTRVLADHHVRVVAWYDNEMGYASRLVDLAKAVDQD